MRLGYVPARWNDEQGHSGFVWSVIGALAEATPLFFDEWAPAVLGRF